MSKIRLTVFSSFLALISLGTPRYAQTSTLPISFDSLSPMPNHKPLSFKKQEGLLIAGPIDPVYVEPGSGSSGGTETGCKYFVVRDRYDGSFWSAKSCPRGTYYWKIEGRKS
jgi:hypothetical protein